MFSTLIFQGENMKQIETVWDTIESYWKKHDKKLITGEGDTQKDIDLFEDEYNVSLPKELIYSLKRNYQNSRHGRDGLQYPWFGSNVGIDLLSIGEIQESYDFYKKYSGLEDIELPNISVVCIGAIQPYKHTIRWNKKWIPVVDNSDIPVIIFVDLDEKSENYLKLIALWNGHLEDVGDHFRFAFIANNYLEFINDLEDIFLKYQKQNNDKMEETEPGKGFEFYYYELKFQLPKGFWTDEYRAEEIKKLGL
jgi:cell wall assembly regulator SMI1